MDEMTELDTELTGVFDESYFINLNDSIIELVDALKSSSVDTLDAITKISNAVDQSSALYLNWLLVIITAVYATITLVICLINFCTFKEQKRQFKLINKPNIDIKVVIIRSWLLCLKIENTGSKMAYDVIVRVNDDFIECIEKITDNKKIFGPSMKRLSNSTFNLGIGQNWLAVICDHKELNKIDIVLEITFSFKDEGKLYKEQIIKFDFSKYNWIEIYDSPLVDIAKYQKMNLEYNKKIFTNISNTLVNIEKSLQGDDSQNIQPEKTLFNMR